MNKKFFLLISFIGQIVSVFCSIQYAHSSEFLTVKVVSDSSHQSYQYLVRHSDMWQYRLGTNAPQVDWKTTGDSLLDNSWLNGAGGFGYEDGDDATVLLVMSNRFSTLYIRKSFTIDSSVDLNSKIELVMDYDDGFIAYIDGIEVARSPNAPGSVGTEPPYNTMSLPPNHEALGYRGLPAEVYNLGTVGSRLQPGTHILSIIGFNGTLNSSDFSLIPDLRVVSDNTVNGEYFSFVYSNKVLLYGTNSASGSTGVTVNGLEASFNYTNKYWEFLSDVSAGVNRFFIAAVDSYENVISSTNKYVVFVQNLNKFGGVVSNDMLIEGNGRVTEITNDVFLNSGVSMTFEPGSVILMNQSASIYANSNSCIYVYGSESSPVYFIPSDGTTPWRGIVSYGINSLVVISNAEIVAGQVAASTNSVLKISNSTLRDLRDGSRLLVGSTNSSSVLINKCRISDYNQIRFSSSPVTIEDCLIENVYSDACDFADSQNIEIRRTTFRYGFGSNTDAIDLGNNPGTIIDTLLVHHFPDKAVSIADLSHNVIVSNSLFYSNGIGVSAYGSSNCIFTQNTVVDNNYGLWLRERTIGYGSGIGTNNIVWGNKTNILATDGSTIELHYSDIQYDTIFPGIGNINTDPLFIEASSGNYFLASNSPALMGGYEGTRMGFFTNPGGIPGEPLNFIAFPINLNTIVIKWIDNSENEEAFVVQISTNNIDWSNVATISANSTSYQLTNIVPDVRYYLRIKAVNGSGSSPFSNLATVMTSYPQIFYGGVLSTNTVWSPERGTIIVSSNLIVPTNISLTVMAGTIIKVATNTIIRATDGGTILIGGTFDNPVKIIPLDSPNVHREVSAYGTNSTLTIHYADISGVQATVYNGAEGLIEDSYLHDYDISNSDPIVLTYFSKYVAIRRCHFNNYYELLLRNGVHLIEDCLFEHTTGDALDFDAAHPGTIVRRSTFRNGPNTNIDGVDVGNDDTNYSTSIIIEDCVMHDFPYDKGISIGDGSSDIVVRNCLIYNCNSGVAVKDECNASIYNCTLVSNNYGINLQAKYPTQYQGGRATNTYNNIIWGNQTQIFVTNNPVIVVNFSDIEGTNWTGIGNISLNPMFRNPAAGDFRLSSDSPCIGTGSNNMTMGVHYPVGGLPSEPGSLTITSNRIDKIILSWVPPTNFHTGFIVERSINDTDVLIFETKEINYSDTLTIPGAIYKYKIYSTNFIGSSFSSEEVSIYAPDKPVIINNPLDLTVKEGETAVFSIVAETLGGAHYQWYFNSNQISAAIDSTLTINNAERNDAGEYYVVVTDIYGNSATSSTARLVVNTSQLSIDASKIGFESSVFKIKIGSHSDKIYVLQASQNLSSWSSIYTNNGMGSVIDLIDNEAILLNRRFYRVLILNR